MPAPEAPKAFSPSSVGKLFSSGSIEIEESRIAKDYRQLKLRETAIHFCRMLASNSYTHDEQVKILNIIIDLQGCSREQLRSEL